MFLQSSAQNKNKGWDCFNGYRIFLFCWKRDESFPGPQEDDLFVIGQAGRFLEFVQCALSTVRFVYHNGGGFCSRYWTEPRLQLPT